MHSYAFKDLLYCFFEYFSHHGTTYLVPLLACPTCGPNLISQLFLYDGRYFESGTYSITLLWAWQRDTFVKLGLDTEND